MSVLGHKGALRSLCLMFGQRPGVGAKIRCRRSDENPLAKGQGNEMEFLIPPTECVIINAAVISIREAPNVLHRS